MISWMRLFMICFAVFGIITSAIGFFYSMKTEDFLNAKIMFINVLILGLCCGYWIRS